MAAKQWSPERRAKFEATLAAKKAKKKRSKKKARRAAAPNGHAETVPDGALLGDRFVQLVADSVGPIVRAIVREEIRRMLS